LPEKAQAEHTFTGASAGNNDPYGIVEKILGYHKTINPDKYVFSPLWNPQTGEYYEPDRQDRIVIWDRHEPFSMGFDLSKHPIKPHDFLLTTHLSNEDSLLQCSDHVLYFDVYFDNNIDRVDNTKFDKLADILLGNPKPIREKILAKLEDYDLLESSLVNLFYVYRSPDMPICELENIITDAQDSMVKYNGNWISQTLPTEIYTRTALSFIAESDPQKFYITEKTFKPLLAGRPFLGLQSRRALQQLKKLGFETFDRWWDESYDDIKDQKERAHACVDILNQLSKNNLSLMLQDMEDVLEHNHNVAKQGIEFFHKDAIHFINNLT